MRRTLSLSGLRCFFRACCLALAIGVGLPVALAQSAPQSSADQDLISMPLEDLARVKVYSASRHFEDAQAAPAAVSILTAEDIRRYGWQTLGEALRSLRGFYASYDRQYTYVGVRGFLRPGDYNSRILLLIDGHRLNENVFDQALLGTEFPLDLDLVDHIEVVRGPGSSLFGTNAVFAVINVITRSARAQAAAEFSGQSGTFLSRSARVTALGGANGATGLLSVTLHRNPGAPTLFFPQFASPATSNGLAENMDGGHFEQGFAALSVGNFHLQGLFGDHFKTYPTAAYGELFNDPADWNNDTRGYLEASYHRSLPGTEIETRVYYDVYNYVGSGAYPGPVPVPKFYKARADWVGAEADLSRSFGQQRVTAGAQYEDNLDIVQRNFLVGQPDSLHLDDMPWLAALYGDAELRLLPKTILHAGARIDWFDAFGAELSPRLAVIYSPTLRSTLKYILGRAFRAPNAYEQFYADGATLTAAPRVLVPEEILTHELVFEHRLTPGVAAIVDGFYNQLQKLIDQVPAPTSGLSYFVNVGRVHAQGVGLEMDARRGSGLEFRASFTATDARDDVARASLANSPHTQAKFNGSMPLARWGEAGVEAIYLSALTDYRGRRVPAYLLPSLTLSTRPILGGWQFSSSCYDAPNLRWFSPLGPNDPEDQIPMDGRTWRFKLTRRLPPRGEGGRP
jgi:outer membrane receptor for ferrienterochelin and colicins